MQNPTYPEYGLKIMMFLCWKLSSSHPTKNIMQYPKEHYGRDLSWQEYNKELIHNTIPDSIKEWMINKARVDDGWSGASEMREHYKWFFRHLHKDLEPEELRSTYIP